ncbi:MAG: sulfite exporter TauE/SafE family protein [Clostridia bacterium]
MWITLSITALFSGIISGMGIGGGSVFILLTTIFNVFEHVEAASYNLIMFLVIGISASIYNLKKDLLDKKMFKKLVIPICTGSLIGVFIASKLNSTILKSTFYIFMIIIGIYEIITSLKRMILANTKDKKGDE